MLVEFSVGNFRSIREPQTISMVAGSGSELRASNVVDSGAPATPDLLRSVVMYGPNASGKSNLLRAFSAMRKLVLGSAQGGQEGEDIDVTPFSLDDGTMADQPTRFEVVFVESGTRFQYGFEVTSKRVVAEWLLAYPRGQAQLWFERDTQQERGWQFGASLKGQKKVWQAATRDNALFLSTAVQLNASQLIPVFSWFQKRLRVVTPGANVLPGFTAHQCDRDPVVRDRVVDFLRVADLGVSGARVEGEDFEPSMLPKDMPESVRKDLQEQLKGGKRFQVMLTHEVEGGPAVELDLNMESDGTRKMFGLAGPLLDVLTNGWVLIIDELDTSLHPLLMRKVVQMFHDPDINRNNAQLLFSTHDTSVLDRTVFRRDQVWFVEKDRELQSHLYPLSDFKPRKEENFERGYLQGRYGALPYIGEWRL